MQSNIGASVFRVSIFKLFFFLVILTVLPSISAQDENTPDPDNTAEQTAPPEEQSTESSDEGESSKKVIFNRSKVEIAPPIALDKQQKDDLEHYLPENEIEQLSAGEEQFISLKQASKTRNSKGVVVFLPDWQQTPVSPKAINFLRNALPTKGWVTIAMQPPLKPIDYPSLLEDNAARIEANKQALQTYQADLTTKLQAVMDKTKNYPGIILLITQGNNAGILFNLYQQNKLPSPTALIMLSAHMLTKEDNQQFAANMAKSSFPVFDLLLTKDHPQVASSANLRKIAVDKEMKIFYRQRVISNQTPSYYPQKTLLKEIDSWLKSVGW